MNLCVSLCGLHEYFREKKTPSRLPMTTTGHVLSWPDYHKTKENVNITLLDWCLFTSYLVHDYESTWHWL